jgi:hypothetical protein
MLKRIFWLALLALGGWLLWSLWRQRQGADHAPMPQFAPIAPATPSEPSISSAAAPTPASVPAATPAQSPLPTTADSNGASPKIVPSDSADGSATLIREAAEASDAIMGYCTRCRAKRPIQDAREELTENGRRAARGTCPVCGGNMYTFLKKEP